ncbi:MAG TPA: hypothetical protein VGA13_09215 [Acidimicrobiales bacterium]|jgi:hypothetical protein
MSADGATLSSIASSIEEVTGRIAEIAGRYSDTERDEIAAALFEVERSLTTATRRLERVVDALGT